MTEINHHIYNRDASLSPCAVMLGLLYMHRLVHKNPNYLTTTCGRDLFLVSMVGIVVYQYVVLQATMNVLSCYVCYSLGMLTVFGCPNILVKAAVTCI